MMKTAMYFDDPKKRQQIDCFLTVQNSKIFNLQ